MGRTGRSTPWKCCHSGVIQLIGWRCGSSRTTRPCVRASSASRKPARSGTL
ncbi:hypothetical protein ACFQQB_20465 [Nonomuraea rubra]|uniref:hypothetical protein n=1 Tax=Nonomuraea rubra TaxID=46180 RepID=UPI0036102613